MACGAFFTAAVAESGELIAWGDDGCGQLGHGGFDSESLQGHLVLIKFFRAHW